MNKSVSSAADILRNLSVQDFLNFGAGHIAYVRASVEAEGGAYALYAANGALLTHQDSPELAMTAARHNGLEPVTVQ